jgi:hypothetical protein
MMPADVANAHPVHVKEEFLKQHADKESKALSTGTLRDQGENDVWVELDEDEDHPLPTDLD